MHKILADTCVWLDMAKDPDQETVLTIIEQLIEMNELALIVPRTILDEFTCNKGRIIKENNKSLSGVFKRVKDIIIKHGDPKRKTEALNLLNDVDYKIPSLGENAAESVSRINKLLKKATIIEISDEIKLKAAQRAIEKRAPFHLNKNSMNDAIIIETYANCLKAKDSIGVRFAFVTHNKNDFSLQQGDSRIPHPDIETFFSKRKSIYFIKLAEAVHRIRPDLVTEIMLKSEFLDPPRELSQILEAMEDLFQKIWYNRHQNWLYKIKSCKHKIVDKTSGSSYIANETPKEVYERALKAAKKVEQQYRPGELGPWDDFEWGMLNGKLSALRWVTGDDWDNLDT